jgi:hypothetical protein
MITGLIGALSTLIAIRNCAQNEGSYYIFALLTAAIAYPLKPEIGLYNPEVVDQVYKKFQ